MFEGTSPYPDEGQSHMPENTLKPISKLQTMTLNSRHKFT